MPPLPFIPEWDLRCCDDWSSSVPPYGKCRQLPWPSPDEVAACTGIGDHLLLGVTWLGFVSFLLAIGFPEAYNRSPEDIVRNGPLKRGREIGYDLVVYIRAFMLERGYEQFSALEVMYAAGHRHVNRADALLSHIQSERVRQTVKLMTNFQHRFAAFGDDIVYMFLDYMTLRQCVSDFLPDQIHNAIATFGNVVLGCSRAINNQPMLFSRVWCVFELYCCIKSEGKIHAVSDSTVNVIPSTIKTMDIRTMKSSKPEDKQTMIEYLASFDGGIDAVNCKAVSTLQQVRKEQLISSTLMTICFVSYSGFSLCILIALLGSVPKSFYAAIVSGSITALHWVYESICPRTDEEGICWGGLPAWVQVFLNLMKVVALAFIGLPHVLRQGMTAIAITSSTILITIFLNRLVGKLLRTWSCASISPLLTLFKVFVSWLQNIAWTNLLHILFPHPFVPLVIGIGSLFGVNILIIFCMVQRRLLHEREARHIDLPERELSEVVGRQHSNSNALTI